MVTHAPTRMSHALWRVSTHVCPQLSEQSQVRGIGSGLVHGHSGSLVSGRVQFRVRLAQIRVPDACPLLGEDASHQSVTATCRSPVLLCSSVCWPACGSVSSLSLVCFNFFSRCQPLSRFNFFSDVSLFRVSIYFLPISLSSNL